jgi:hypothetical protein
VTGAAHKTRPSEINIRLDDNLGPGGTEACRGGTGDGRDISARACVPVTIATRSSFMPAEPGMG